MTLDSEGSSELYNTSPLLCLPQELRTLCFRALLKTNSTNEATFGIGSGLDLSILSVCKSLHDEVSELLYSTAHRIIIPCGPMRCKDESVSCGINRCRIEPQLNIGYVPPHHALRRLKHITLEINFETENRGECEMQIMHYEGIIDQVTPLSMALLHSTCLQSVTIGLLNHAQRKVGNRRLRGGAVLFGIKWLLRPFAYLPRQVSVRIDGFDTIEYADMFETLREEFAGRPVPITEWIEETIDKDEASFFGEGQCS